MNERLEFIGDSVILTVMQVEDITDSYINGLNDPEVNRYLDNVRLTQQTYGSVKKYVEAKRDSENNVFLKMMTKEAKKFIGTVHVSNICYFHYLCNVGICIFNKECWGKGYAAESIRLVRDYVFKTLGLHFIGAGVYADNVESCALFQRSGFSELYRVSNKYRYSDDFAEVVFWGDVNLNFDKSILKKTDV